MDAEDFEQRLFRLCDLWIDDPNLSAFNASRLALIDTDGRIYQVDLPLLVHDTQMPPKFMPEGSLASEQNYIGRKWVAFIDLE